MITKKEHEKLLKELEEAWKDPTKGVCSRCGTAKDITEFFNRKPNVIYPFYLYYCKDCVRLYYWHISEEKDRLSAELQHLIDL